MTPSHPFRSLAVLTGVAVVVFPLAAQQPVPPGTTPGTPTTPTQPADPNVPTGQPTPGSPGPGTATTTSTSACPITPASSVTVTATGAVYPIWTPRTGTAFQTGQNADILLSGIRFNMNLPEHAIIRDGQFSLADTINNRVLYWSSLESARSQAPEVIFGASDLNDVTPEIGRNKLFWPAAMAFDGQNLWVGEYKFSNRVVRFSKR